MRRNAKIRFRISALERTRTRETISFFGCAVERLGARAVRDDDAGGRRWLALDTPGQVSVD
jgi:hypothetical protein